MERRMKGIAIWVAAVMAAASAGVALRAQAPPPGAETLLDGHVKATGGRAAFDRLNTRVVKAKLEVPAAGISMAVSIWAARPNRTRTLVESDVIGRVERGFDGKVAWEVSTTSGPRLLEGAQLEDVSRDSTFDGLAAWRDWVEKAETVGAAEVGGKPAWKVLLTPKRGSAQTYFFDQASGLAVKLEMNVRSPMGDVPVESYFGDYRDVEGVRVAHRLRQVAASQELVTTIGSVAHNVEIPAGQFDLPKEIQALAAKK